MELQADSWNQFQFLLYQQGVLFVVDHTQGNNKTNPKTSNKFDIYFENVYLQPTIGILQTHFPTSFEFITHAQLIHVEISYIFKIGQRNIF